MTQEAQCSATGTREQVSFLRDSPVNLLVGRKFFSYLIEDTHQRKIKQ